MLSRLLRSQTLTRTAPQLSRTFTMAATEQKVAIVTGTNSGVGLALSVQLATAQYKVYAGMRGVTPEKRAALDEAATTAGVADRINVIEMDVSNEDSVNAAVKQVVDESGRIDILVNNAGYSLFGSIEMVSMSDVESQFNTNVYGVIRCQKAVLPTMRAQKSGKIVNVSSVGGVWGQPFNDVYCATKFALEGLAESQAALFRTFGVYVSSVQPGAIQTAFIANAKKPDFATIPSEYHAPIQNTMASYQSGNSTGQTADEVAQAIMDQVVNVDQPNVKIQTNPKIQRIFDMQLADATGEAGAKAGHDRFLTPKE